MKMTSRERIIAAMRGEPIDTVPISPRTGVFLTWRYGKANIETALRFQRDFDQDLCWQAGSGLVNPIDSVEFDTSYNPEIRLEVTRRQDGDTTIVGRTFHTPAGRLTDLIRVAPPNREYGISPNPEKIEFLIKDDSDVEKLRYILPNPEKYVNLANFNNIEAALGENGLTQVFLRGPVDHYAGDARGVVNLMTDYYDEPALLGRILELFTAHIMSETKVCLERGVRHVFGSWYYTSLSTGWSPAMFRELFLPLMKRHVALVHSYGATYAMYDDGKLMTVLPDYVETGADTLETMTPPPVGDADLREAKRIVGNRMTLKGYTDLIYVLQRGTPELVRRTVIEALEAAAPGGRFILGTSDSIRENTPEENLAAYFSTAREYGSKFL